MRVSAVFSICAIVFTVMILVWAIVSRYNSVQEQFIPLNAKTSTSAQVIMVRKNKIVAVMARATKNECVVYFSGQQPILVRHTMEDVMSFIEK